MLLSVQLISASLLGVSLLKPGHRAYLEMDRVARENAFSNVTFRAAMRATGDRPEPVVLDWGTGTPPYSVAVRADGETIWSATLPTRSAEVHNLEIARDYAWTARDAKGKVVGGGRFRTADEAPRLLNIPGVPNVRDLGGRIGLGGRRIRQGLVYRSAGWNDNASRTVFTNGTAVVTNWTVGAVRCTPAAAELFVKPLGIRTDLDLRSDDECRGMSGSPIGKDVRRIQVSSGNYWDMTNAVYKAAFAADFRVFLDRENYPIVFHCIAGADRTGSLACILNALLGVGEDELAKDWEMTGFANDHVKLRHDIRWNLLVGAFGGYPGETLNARIEAYVRDCGFTDADIARFREIMLTAAGAVRTQNLLVNADCSQDGGLGEPAGWTFTYPRGTKDGAAAVPKDGCFQLTMPKGTTYFRQSGLSLLPGETYRMRAEVRTSNVPRNGVMFTLFDRGWDRELKSAPFPADTGGAWQPVEWEGAAFPSKCPDGGFSLAVRGTTGAGWAEIRNLTLEPVSQSAVAHARTLPVRTPSVFRRRIVPIDPLLAKVPDRDAAMTFYFPAPSGSGELRLSVRVDNGRPVPSVAIAADGRARVPLGALRRGAHVLSAEVRTADDVIVATNGYAFTVVAPKPEGPSGRRLNNLVTELLNAPLANGTYRYFCPDDTWVWFSHPDAMRWQAAGWHELTVTDAPASGGRLRIHAVPMLLVNNWALEDGPSDFSGRRYRYRKAFAERYLVRSFNTINPGNWHRDRPEKAYYEGLGYGIVPQLNLEASSPIRLDAAKTAAAFDSSRAWREGYDVEVDENSIAAPRPSTLTYAEQCWRMVAERPQQAIHTDWADAPETSFDDPLVHVSAISAVVNSGGGRGLLVPEVYSPALNDPARAYRWEEHFVRFARDAEKLVPAAHGKNLFFFATYIDLGSWCDYPAPEADIKAHYAHFLHSIATSNAFADVVSGLALGGLGNGEEEAVRWFARCVRHYAVEGRTGDLAAQYGFAYLPGLVKNCDFAQGLSGWEPFPAPGGGLAAERLPGYGTQVQWRKKVPKGTGDGVAVFTRSAAGPNRLCQRLTGLVPGRLYALMYCTADRGDVLAKDGRTVDCVFSATLDGADEVLSRAFRRTNDTRPVVGKKPVSLSIHRQVFRAKSETATLVFSDWDERGASAVPVGTKRVLNYVVFRPYYLEAGEDADCI